MVNLKCKLCALILFANLCLHLAAIFAKIWVKGENERGKTETEGKIEKKRWKEVRDGMKRWKEVSKEEKKLGFIFCVAWYPPLRIQ